MFWRDFEVEVMEHWVIAYIDHLKTEVDANTLFTYLVELFSFYGRL
jgi:hypothetical protein